MKNINIIKNILPKQFVEHFDLKNIKSQEELLEFYLDQKSIVPKEHLGKDLESKGFTIAIPFFNFHNISNLPYDNFYNAPLGL